MIQNKIYIELQWALHGLLYQFKEVIFHPQARNF